MPFLITLISIIALIIIVLSIRLSVLIEYSEYITLKVKWLFLEFNLLPLTSGQLKKQAKKEQKKEEKKTQKEPGAEAAAPEAPAEKTEPAAKKPSLLKELLEAHGYDGLVKMLKDSVNALNTFLWNAVRSVVIDELYYTMRVSKPDAASTAVEYGKVCAELYPLFGALVTKLKTKRYDIDIFPDYLAYKSETFLHIRLLVCPRKVINASLGLVFRLLFKVVLKVLIKLLRKPKKQSKIKNTQNKGKGGALV